MPLPEPQLLTPSAAGPHTPLRCCVLHVQVCIPTQYPLRPVHLLVPPDSVQSVSVRPESRQVRVELTIPSRGGNYSHSRGEGYARDAAMAPTSTAPPYQRFGVSADGGCHLHCCLPGSGMMDHLTMTSDPQPPLSHRYVAGVLREGEWSCCLLLVLAGCGLWLL